MSDPKLVKVSVSLDVAQDEWPEKAQWIQEQLAEPNTVTIEVENGRKVRGIITGAKIMIMVEGAEIA